MARQQQDEQGRLHPALAHNLEEIRINVEIIHETFKKSFSVQGLLERLQQLPHTHQGVSECPEPEATPHTIVPNNPELSYCRPTRSAGINLD